MDCLFHNDVLAGGLKMGKIKKIKVILINGQITNGYKAIATKNLPYPVERNTLTKKEASDFIKIMEKKK